MEYQFNDISEICAGDVSAFFFFFIFLSSIFHDCHFRPPKQPLSSANLTSAHQSFEAT